jgi:transposase-like protein
MDIKIQNLVDDESSYEAVRNLRWPDGVRCPCCHDKAIIKRGRDEKARNRQRYECKAQDCGKRFDDLTDTVFAGHHQPLKVWMIFLYFMGLNLSTRQIAQELNLNKDDAQHMAEILRSGVVEKKPEIALSGEVECDEV